MRAALKWLLALLAALLLAAPELATAADGARASTPRGRKKKKPSAPKEKHDAPGAISLNGETMAVRWTDGDSFKFLDGPYKGQGTRLTGYNTLEAYGPVHQWGTWTAQELYELAKSSSAVAATQTWDCTTTGKQDGYRRLLVSCPKLAVHMVREGHALAFAVDGEKADPLVLAAQEAAMREGKGMWAKGTTKGVVTSLHSVGEDGPDEDGAAYNRVVDTRTGQALKRKHSKTYDTCENVCVDTDGESSCMVYVPFKKRYRGQPDCLKPKD